MPIYVQTSSGAKSEVTDLRIQQDSERVQPEAVFAQVNRTQRAVVWAPRQRLGADSYPKNVFSRPIGIHRRETTDGTGNGFYWLFNKYNTTTEHYNLYILGKLDTQENISFNQDLNVIGQSTSFSSTAWAFCGESRTSNDFFCTK